MKLSVASLLVLASTFSLVASRPEANAAVQYGPAPYPRNVPQMPRNIDHQEMVRDTVRDLMSKRTLTEREELVKRSIVTDVLNGMLDIFKAGKVDLNAPLRQATVGLRNVSSTIDFNKAIPEGFNNAIDQNQDIANMPFGTVVASVAKSIAGGFNWNSLITNDGFNFVDGLVSQVDANAVTASGIQAVVQAIST